MMAGEICSRPVQTVRPDATVLEAARRMERHAVGSLVVIGRQGPVEGVLTDRDVVVRWAAREASASTTVADVMTRGMVAIAEETPVERAVAVMAEREVRRLVVTNEDGDLVGVLALDDILESLTEETEAIRRLLRGQVAASAT